MNRKRVFLLRDKHILIWEDGQVTLRDQNNNSIKLTKGQKLFVGELAKYAPNLVSHAQLYNAYAQNEGNEIEERLHKMKTSLHKNLKTFVEADYGKGYRLIAPEDGQFLNECHIEERKAEIDDAYNCYMKLGQTYFATRGDVEEAFPDNIRFGPVIDYIKRCREEGKPCSSYDGEQPIKSITFVGLAGTALFMPSTYLDQCQRFNFLPSIFQELFSILLQDSTFFLNAVIAEPYSPGALSAVASRHITNEQFTSSGSLGQEVFIASFVTVRDAIRCLGSPYNQAYQDRRLSIRLTDKSLPCAMLKIEYKARAKALYGYRDEIKLDLYTANLSETAERPSLILFEGEKMYEVYNRQLILYRTDSGFSKDIDDVATEDVVKWETEWIEWNENRKKLCK